MGHRDQFVFALLNPVGVGFEELSDSLSRKFSQYRGRLVCRLQRIVAVLPAADGILVGQRLSRPRILGLKCSCRMGFSPPTRN